MSANTESQLLTAPSILYRTACLLFIIVLFFACLWVARPQWFYGDDFIFLSQARRAHDWLQIFLPTDGRVWWSYRPLTIEVYFVSLFRTAGLDVFPYLVVSLVFHFTSGFLVFRLARQLHFDRSIAFLMAALSIAAVPSMHEVFWPSAFQHIGGRFFFLAATSLFLDHLQRGGIRFQMSALGMGILTFFSNEFSIILAGVLFLLAFYCCSGNAIDRIRSAVRKTSPHIILLGGYLIFRYYLIGPAWMAMPDAYLPKLGPHIFINLAAYPYIMVDNQPLAASFVVTIIGGAWVVAIALHNDAWRRLVGRSLLFLAWSLAVLTPFLAIECRSYRWAILAETPAVLLLGAHLEVVSHRFRSRHRGRVETLLVLLLVAAAPVSILRSMAENPPGAQGRALVRLIKEKWPKLPPEGCIILQVAPESDGSSRELKTLQFQLTPNPDSNSSQITDLQYRTAGLTSVVWPGSRIRLVYPGQKAPKKSCLELELPR